MKSTHTKYIFFALLIILFAVQFFYISPKGNFPLNDDWVHADTIKHWAETGEFRLMPFAGPTFYVPILYGTAITKIFDFSFTIFRISTLVLTFFLLSTFYFLLYKLSNKPALAFLGTLLLWLNPIFYNLSFTFMTDVPALFFLMLSIYFYYSGFEKENNQYLFWGTIFGLLSTFTRQTGILIVIAALFYYLMYRRPAGRLYRNILITFGLPLAIAGLIYTWLNVFQLTPQSTLSHTIEGGWRLLGHIKWWLFYIPMYLGLFTLPLTLSWFIKHHHDWKNKKFWTIFIIIAGLAVSIRQIWHLQFPYMGNIISNYGLGPMKSVLDGQLIPLLPSWAWGIITMFSALGLSLFFYLLTHRRHNNEPIGFIYFFGFLYLIPLLIFESFDRYLLPLLIILIIAIIQNIKHVKFSYFTSLILISTFGFFSLTQTHFYLAWNSSRFELAQKAQTLTNEPTQIDAGYEWDGWNNYWSIQKNDQRTPEELNKNSNLIPWWKRYFWSTSEPKYLVSFSEKPGYQTIDKRSINSFNPNNQLYLLEKK